MPRLSVVEPSAAPTRRKPFASSPTVGPRGLQTHQRILDAALTAFGESGYDRTSLDRVAELAGCSRVAIYQYVAGKEELFGQLATHAATEMWAALESLDDVTADAGGHAALLAYVSRLADVEVRYEPILRAFQAAAVDDAALEGGAASIVRRGVEVLGARIVGTDLPPRLLDPTIELLNTGLISALSRMSILRAAAPGHYGRERVDLALADVAHRALFGVVPGVNVHAPPPGTGPPVLRLSEAADAIFRRAAEVDAVAAMPSKRALRSMLGVANGLLAERGYRGLRVDDVVRAAGVSRGSFYTYFVDIEEFVRLVGVRAIQDVSTVVGDLPEVASRADVRRWLARYAEVNLTSGPLVRVWIEAIEGPLRDDRAAVIDWGRRRLAAMLRARPLGDVDVSAEILLAVVEVFGSAPRSKAEVDACLALIERAFVNGGPNHGQP